MASIEDSSSPKHSYIIYRKFILAAKQKMKNTKIRNQMQNKPKQESAISHKIITKLHQILKTFSRQKLKCIKIWQHEKFFVFFFTTKIKKFLLFFRKNVLCCIKHTLDSTKS